MMPKPGKYRHFKGKEYALLGSAIHSETLDTMVIYKALYEDGKTWVRPASMWEETVEKDGYCGPRFQYIGPYSPETPADVRICTDLDAILTFLAKIDDTLPVPLSKRVDLRKFAQQNLSRGYIFGIEVEGVIVCAAFFYYHFQDMPYAYFDLLATVPGHYGHGYAGKIMDAAEEAARQAGMTQFHLHTNDTNKVAVTMYQKRGYEVIDTEHKLHMRKML